MLVGDFNLNWLEESYYVNKLKRIINYLNVIQNVRDCTTDHSSTLIDLIISRDEVNHVVLNSSMISDHNIIEVKAEVTKELAPQTIHTRGAINYNAIRNSLNAVDWREMYLTGSIDGKFNKFYATLQNLLNSVAPIKNLTVRNEVKPWVTQEIRDKIIERDRLYLRFKFTRETEDWTSYKRVRNEIVKGIRQNKFNYYDKKIDECKKDKKGM